MPLALVSLAVLLSGPAKETANPARAAMFDVVWRVDLGPSDRLVYRSAVCSDGTTFLADSSGRVVAVSTSGETLLDVRTTIEMPVAATCNRAGALVAATVGSSGTQLTTVSRDPSQRPLTVTLQGPAAVVLGRPYSVAVVDPDTVVLALADPRRNGVRIAFVRADGGIGALTPPLADRPAGGSAGTLVWDATRDRVIYVSSERYAFETFDRRGTPGESRSLRARLRSASRERVERIAQVPGVGFVSQILGATRSSAEPRQPTVRFEVLGPDLELLAEKDGGDPGLLIGADDEGHLYFQHVVADGGTAIVKARLDLRR